MTGGDVMAAPAELDAATLAERLTARYGEMAGQELVAAAVTEIFPGRIALVSSFGIEAAVLLDMVARVAPATPVLFLDTGKLFPETLRYRDRLIARLGLEDVRTLTPDAGELAAVDPTGDLNASDPDSCCGVRKVAPLARGLRGFDAWLTGRKRFQGGLRARLPLFEAADGRVKVNPLASWAPEDIQRAFRDRGLPRHPMAQVGYRSIGCVPCSAPAPAAADPRAGRWPGQTKTECGIHFPVGGPEGRAATPEPETGVTKSYHLYK